MDAGNGNYIKTTISSLRDLAKCALCADLFLFFFLLLIGHGGETFFESDGERDKWVTRVVDIDPRLDFWEP